MTSENIENFFILLMPLIGAISAAIYQAITSLNTARAGKFPGRSAPDSTSVMCPEIELAGKILGTPQERVTNESASSIESAL
jgi:hypothetical protein